MKRKIAAILAADIVGYSRLIAEDEEETLRRLNDYQRVFKDVIVEAGGRIFKTAGDSVLAEFPSAVDALRCAINVQESLRIRNQAYPVSRQMAFRMGLTIGDVVDQDGDLLGDGVNIAARLEALAPPGGICISKAMYDAVSSKLSVTYIDMGSHQVKNMPSPIHVFSVSPDARAPGKGALHSAGQTLSRPSQWLKPSSALAGLAVALVSGVLVASVMRPSGTPPTSTETPATTVATATPAVSQPPPSVVVSDDTAGENVAVAEKKVEPASPPAANAVSAGDVIAAQRLPALRWAACRGDDTKAALKACGDLVADASIETGQRAEAQQRLGLALRKDGDLDGALTALTGSVQTLASSSAYNDRGTAHLLKGDLVSAIADYNEAIKLDAKNGEALNNRAWAHYKSGAHAKALEDANKAVTLIEEKAYAWDTRGHIQEALGARKAAESDFLKALSLDSELATSQSALKRLTGR